MVSLKIYKSDPFDRTFFKNEFGTFNKELERSTQLKEEYVFKASIDKFKCIHDDFVTFEFQHDLRHEINIRGRMIEYPRFHHAEFWIFFTPNTNYLFVSGDESSVEFLVGKLFLMIKDVNSKNENFKENFKDLQYERLSLENDTFLEILQTDALKINASWWNKVDLDLKSAFLSGNLKDKDGEHEVFRLIKEKGGNISTAYYLSTKIGYRLNMSRKNVSITASKKEVEAGSLLNYFKEIIYPLLKTT